MQNLKITLLFAKVCLNFISCASLFQLFGMKNIEKAVFDQPLYCEVPKPWSKDTANLLKLFKLVFFGVLESKYFQDLKILEMILNVNNLVGEC